MVSGAGALILLPLLLFAESAPETGAKARGETSEEVVAEAAVPAEDCGELPVGPVIESPHDAATMEEWLTALRHRVHAKWVLPRSVREGEVGTVVLRFVVDRRGRVNDLETPCATGDRSLEKASRRAVKAATPLPPLPDAFEGDSLIASWRFHYHWRKDLPHDEEYPADSWVR